MNRMLKYVFLLLSLSMPGLAVGQNSPEDAGVMDLSEDEIVQILSFADKATGENIDGLTWKIDIVSNSDGENVSEQTLQMKATEEKWVAETLRPKRSRGQKLLKINKNMWFTKRGLRKPVPISRRQRLTGGVSNGDVASTRYAKDYDAQLLGYELVEGNKHYVFDLEAKHNSVTYDKVKYWVGYESGLGVKAEFYSKTGKLLKTASFNHDNTASYQGEIFPFISSMTITDKISNDISYLTYYDISVTNVPAAEFRL